MIDTKLRCTKCGLLPCKCELKMSEHIVEGAIKNRKFMQLEITKLKAEKMKLLEELQLTRKMKKGLFESCKKYIARIKELEEDLLALRTFGEPVISKQWTPSWCEEIYRIIHRTLIAKTTGGLNE